MKAMAWSLVCLLILHLLAAIGFVAWLGATGRINRERIMHVVDTFELTIQEQAARQAQADELAAQTQAIAQQAARLEAVADGPQTLQDRLALEEQADELAIHRLERLHQETQDLRDQIERAKQLLAERKAALETEREAFDVFLQERTQRLQDEDFQQAVAMYEQLKADQAKQMFQTLLAEGKVDEVVNYLAAMQLRKAAGVLKKFETPAEIRQATMLIQKLSARGVYPMGDPGTPGTPGGPVAEATDP